MKGTNSIGTRNYLMILIAHQAVRRAIVKGIQGQNQETHQKKNSTILVPSAAKDGKVHNVTFAKQSTFALLKM